MAGVCDPTYGPVEDYDLYLLDTRTGEVTLLSDLDQYGLFNASFSNNGKQLVHDAVDKDTCANYQGFTDVRSGETTVDTSLVANDNQWSPDGRFIAFDTLFVLDYPDWNLYVMPAKGGPPALLREFAGSAKWSNSSRRLAFADVDFVNSYPNWGYFATIKLDGSDEVRLDSVGAYGCSFDYARNGQFIVYMEGDPVTFGGCFSGNAPLMAVPLSQSGDPLGDPFPVTDGLYRDVNPSISGNSKTVVFFSDRGTPMGAGTTEWDLWTAPTDGSQQVTRLYGLPGVDEIDPFYSKNGRYIVFTSNRNAVSGP